MGMIAVDTVHGKGFQHEAHLFAQLRLAGWQGDPQGYSGPGSVLGGGDGMAYRGQALQLDRRIHRIAAAAGKASHLCRRMTLPSRVRGREIMDASGLPQRLSSRWVFAGARVA